MPRIVQILIQDQRQDGTLGQSQVSGRFEDSRLRPPDLLHHRPAPRYLTYSLPRGWHARHRRIGSPTERHHTPCGGTRIRRRCAGSHPPCISSPLLYHLLEPAPRPPQWISSQLHRPPRAKPPPDKVSPGPFHVSALHVQLPSTAPAGHPTAPWHPLKGMVASSHSSPCSHVPSALRASWSSSAAQRPFGGSVTRAPGQRWTRDPCHPPLPMTCFSGPSTVCYPGAQSEQRHQRTHRPLLRCGQRPCTSENSTRGPCRGR